MNSEIYGKIYLLGILVLQLSLKCKTQCTFQPPFNDSTWQDNTKGTISFTTQYMTGWAFNPFYQTVSQWQCVNSSVQDYLVMRTTSSFRFQGLSGSWTFVYGYLCLKLTNITDTSYLYYQMHVQMNEIGGERISLSTLSTLDAQDICSETLTVPATEYHVLIKSGSEVASAISCPNSLLFTTDYTYSSTSGISCDTSADVMDVCSNTSHIVFNYTTCTQFMAFSGGGQLSCIANVYSNGYDFVTLLNADASVSPATNTFRFACLSTDGTYASVAPGNCTATQTPYVAPTSTDGTTGHLIIFTNKYSTCGIGVSEQSSGLTGGEIAAIVLCLFVLLITTGWTVFVIIVCTIAAKLFCIILYDAMADSDEPKSSVPLLDIEARLQDLKLNNETLQNGSPLKQASVSVSKQFEHRRMKILPPLKDKKTNSLVNTKANTNNTDKSPRTAEQTKPNLEKVKKVKPIVGEISNKSFTHTPIARIQRQETQDNYIHLANEVERAHNHVTLILDTTDNKLKPHNNKQKVQTASEVKSDQSSPRKDGILSILTRNTSL